MTNVKYRYKKTDPVFVCRYVEHFNHPYTGKPTADYQYVNIRALNREEAKRICKLITGALVKEIDIVSRYGYDSAAENDKDDVKARLYGEGC